MDRADVQREEMNYLLTDYYYYQCLVDNEKVSGQGEGGGWKIRERKVGINTY